MPESTTLWYTRCPVPSASGIAIARRLLDDEFTVPAVRWRPVAEAPGGSEAHFTHDLRGLFREGGNVPALAAYAQSRNSVLIGMTFVPELQAIVVPAASPSRSLADLAGKRFALPVQQAARIDFYRAMALRGMENALASAGMGRDDLVPVDIPRAAAVLGDVSGEGYDAEVAALRDGRAEAAYVKGARGADLISAGVVRAVWTADASSPTSWQINNGTPRAITADRRIVGERPELAARYLRVLATAARWAAGHGDDVVRIVSAETGGSEDGVRSAYGNAFGETLQPSLREDLLESLASQKEFLLRHGFLHHDFQLDDWIDRGPLAAALRSTHDGDISPMDRKGL